MALSAVCPGASTLIGNLLKSSSVRPPGSQRRTLAGRQWLRQYVNGCANQVRLTWCLQCVACKAAWFAAGPGACV